MKRIAIDMDGVLADTLRAELAASHVVFCVDKSILGADVLIDDNAHRFARFPGRRVLFDAPHNALETGHPRVASRSEVARLLLDGDVAPRRV